MCPSKALLQSFKVISRENKYFKVLLCSYVVEGLQQTMSSLMGLPEIMT
jgi:hypothetical protein